MIDNKEQLLEIDRPPPRAESEGRRLRLRACLLSLVPLLTLISVLFAFSSTGSGCFHRQQMREGISNGHSSEKLVARQTTLPALRVMPIGDSITSGSRSTDQNGYRLVLRNLFIEGGYTNVDFIGTQRTGNNNTDNQHEGYGGRNITGITAQILSKRVLRSRPNVVLIHAGTNDMQPRAPPEPAETAPQRLGNLLDQVLCEAPDALVLVAQLVENRQGSTGAPTRTATYNAAIPQVVADRRDRGFKVALVDQSTVAGTTEISGDGLHPSDAGYAHMARNWYEVFQAESARVTPPRPSYGSNGGDCPAVNYSGSIRS